MKNQIAKTNQKNNTLAVKNNQDKIQIIFNLYEGRKKVKDKIQIISNLNNLIESIEHNINQSIVARFNEEISKYIKKEDEFALKTLKEEKKIFTQYQYDLFLSSRKVGYMNFLQIKPNDDLMIAYHSVLNSERNLIFNNISKISDLKEDSKKIMLTITYQYLLNKFDMFSYISESNKESVCRNLLYEISEFPFYTIYNIVESYCVKSKDKVSIFDFFKGDNLQFYNQKCLDMIEKMSIIKKLGL